MKVQICWLGFAWLLGACQAQSTSPLPAPAPLASPVAMASPSPSPEEPEPEATASLLPEPTATLPSELAELRLSPHNTRFLSAQGAQVSWQVEPLDAAGRLLTDSVPLQWRSSRPQDFSVDAQGVLTALVETGYAEITVSIPGTSLLARSLIHVNPSAGSRRSHHTGGGGQSGTVMPVAEPAPVLSQLNASTAQVFLLRGETLLLAGSHFDPELAQNTVHFLLADQQLVSVAPQAVSATELTVRIPPEVALPGEVRIYVETRGQASNHLTAIVPKIQLAFDGGFQ